MTALPAGSSRTLVALCGAAALVLAWLLATPLDRPPPQTPVLPQAGAIPAIATVLWPGGIPVGSAAPGTSVPFVARGEDYRAGLRSDGFVVSAREATGEVVEVRFAGAVGGISPTVAEPAGPEALVFGGSGRTTLPESFRWHQTATFRGVYPGIDAEYRTTDGQLELDFRVHPGADPASIRLQAAPGTSFRRVEGSGEVIALNGASTFVLKAPLAYQVKDGQRTSVPVEARVAGDTLTFGLGDYDRQQALVIDPLVASYSTFIGSSRNGSGEPVNAITSDADGNIYLTGVTQFDTSEPEGAGMPARVGALMPPNPRTSQSRPCEFDCGYVIKLDAQHRVQFAAYLYGMDPRAIDLSPDGTIVVGGKSLTANFFPATPGAFAYSPDRGTAFVLKLASDARSLVYAALFGAADVRDLEVDASGNTTLVGMTDEPTLPVTPGALRGSIPEFNGVAYRDGYAMRIDPSGSTVQFATYFGGNLEDSVNAMALQADGSLFIAGDTKSSVVDGLPSGMDGNADAFVAHLAADGSRLLGARRLGGARGDTVQGLAPDGAGGVIAAGITESPDFAATPSVFQPDNLGDRNGFVARLDGSLLTVYSTFIGGSFIDGIVGVDTDASGTAYLVGTTFSADMPTTPGALQERMSAESSVEILGLDPAFYPQLRDGTREAYFAVLAPDGRSLLYGTYLGGFYSNFRAGSPLTLGVAVHRTAGGKVLVGGSTLTIDFPVTDGGLREGIGAADDGFLVEFANSELSVAAPAMLPPATLQQPYQSQFLANGGTPPYRWQLVGFKLLDGLQLDADGRITGSVANPQREEAGHQFTVKVTDAAGRIAYKAAILNLDYADRRRCDLPGCRYNLQVGQATFIPFPAMARGVSPIAVSLGGNVPPGLTLDVTTQRIVGTPTTAGEYIWSLDQRDARNRAVSLRLQSTVAPDPNAGGGGSGGGGNPPPPPPPPAPAPSGGGGGALGIADLAALLALFALARRRRASAGAP